MLTELSIRGLGVIEEASIEFHPGLTVVTGETGAGKTMIVQGLSLITGSRADAGIVRGRQGVAHVEARFENLGVEIEERIAQAGGVVEGEVLVARQVAATGRSRAWLGGASVPLAIVHDLDLVTIHGQSEQIRLSTPERQREVLDRAAGSAMAQVLATYREKYSQRRDMSAELADLTASSMERRREADMLAFGLSEIEAIDPLDGEDEALIAEAKALQDADQLRSYAEEAVYALAGDETSDGVQPSLTTLNLARKALRNAARVDVRAEHIAQLADDLASMATDLVGQTSTYLADLAADPLRLEWVESRLADLKKLTRKYGVNSTEVREWASQAEEKLGAIQGSDERIAHVENAVHSLDAELASLADSMTEMRNDAAARFSQAIGEELTALAMPRARVEFHISDLPELGPWGRDHVQLLFTANQGSEPAPLGRVASGGELSRVRLAIEVVLADPAARTTFVFDEVDAGIGGAVGLQVGLRLARLASQNQVVVVTHLAQVAAFADHHWVVAKQDDGGVTASGLAQVSDEIRLVELSRMMGGLDQTVSSLAHAQELLDQARSMAAR